MADSSPRRLHEQELAFFGRVAAGQSHEITNVLNIINELAGLQRDILGVALGGGPARLEKLWDTADRIKAQVERGQEIVRHVNRFAHSVDLPVTTFDLKELVERVAFLATRHARLRKSELHVELPEATVTMQGSPFLLELAMCCCIDLAVGAAGESEKVTVTYVIVGGEVLITVASADGAVVDEAAATRLELLRAAAGEIGARFSTAGANERLVRLELAVPVRCASDTADEPSAGGSDGAT